MLDSRTGTERNPAPPSLGDPGLYEAQIRKLASRRERMRWLVPMDEASIALEEKGHEIARRLARTVPREGYEFGPLAPYRAVLHGKPRVIYRVDPLDAVVWGAYARVLAATIDAQLGDHLYSYRRGRSQFRAAAACVRFFREHVAARPDPRARGVFVLRRDVRRYDEAIAVDDESSLWTTLAELTRGAAVGEGAAAARLMKAAFRPRIVQPDGSAVPLPRGMPTGLPTQTIACNVYLLPLDRELAAIDGGFYARFGDDILFAHAELAAARHAAALLEHGTERLGLQLNHGKSVSYWLTGVGRNHPDAPECRPARTLPYLGLDIGFEGTRLRTDKRRALLRDLFARIDHAHEGVKGCDLRERAETIAQVVADALEPQHALVHRYGPWLRAACFARRDLVQLDRLIALHCAERLTGTRGVRAFRELPPRELYSRHGLPSVVQRWDRARRARGAPQ